jgi:hypothetical protein
MKQPIDSKCKVCYKADEHTKHNVAWCTTLVPSEYTIRYNKVAGYINWKICKCTEFQVTDKYYENRPERVIKVSCTAIIWDIPAVTDRTTLANRPDIVLYDKEEKTCLLIDITIPDD